jgi:hypothetical protein
VGSENNQIKSKTLRFQVYRLPGAGLFSWKPKPIDPVKRAGVYVGELTCGNMVFEQAPTHDSKRRPT